eukprot:1819978-Ditylum_brightwellii.AAC.1
MSKLLLHNKLHLNKSWDSPAAKGPLHDYIGQFHTGQGVKDILKGNFDPNKSEEVHEVNYWLKHHIRQVAVDREIKVEISLDNYKGATKAQMESTISSPSGQHYGHYKAILNHDDLCLTKLAVPTLECLHIIVIVERDMNAALKLIWNHRLVPRAEKTNFLAQSNLETAKDKHPLMSYY